jgi:carboxyl-terminal processing protease
MKKLNQALLFLITVLLFVGLFAGKKLFLPDREEKRDYEYLSLLAEVAALVKTDYVDEIDPAVKFPGAFSAMLRELDHCSAYLEHKASTIYDRYQKGDVHGLGIYGAKRQNYFYISDILTDSPADRGGLKPGDIIKGVKGDSIYSLSFWEMYLSLLSTQPEAIELTVFRKNSSKPEKVSLRTRRLGTDTLFKKIKSHVYLIQLLRIDPNSVDFLKKKFEKRSISTLIVDLRKYSGGDYDSFIEISKLLLKESHRLTLKTRGGEEVIRTGSPQAFAGDAAVITGPATIMYGEVLAALFKADGALLVGAATPGQAVTLKRVQLDDSSSILLTAGTFQLDGRPLCESKVVPTVETDERDDDRLIDRCLSLLHRDKT